VDEVVAASRDAGFAGVNLDMVYGLPRQGRDSFWATISRVRAISSDRVACFGYAHLPTMVVHQRAIEDDELPDAATRSALFAMAVEGFTGTGYFRIGLDHFAQVGDSLAVAQRAGQLHRDFMGYTTRLPGHLVGVGMSAIGEVGGRFAQNAAQLERRRGHLADGTLPVVRGHALTAEDSARRAAILRLMCDLQLSRGAVEAFPGTLERLAPFEEDGLETVSWDAVRITPLGRYFLRNVCMTLDAYVAGQPATGAFSRTV
jgi:oxygen-independent coproporphyrinogen-3 oxidase